jgi:hypothetical protein
MSASVNNLGSNTTEKVARVFLDAFEASRVLTKTVDTQLLKGELNPASGTTVKFKRPHDFKVDETAGGDISSTDASDIIAGTSVGTVQNWMTVHMNWSSQQEALQLDQLSEILKPAASRLITKLELGLGAFMASQGNLHYGTPGTVVDAWSDVAGAGALMDSMGVPNDGDRYYVMNPFTTTNLADAQRGLSSGDNSLVNTSWQNSLISNKFGGLQAITSNALSSYTSGTLSAGANRAGTLNGTPTATYVAHKDSMIQSIVVAGFGAGSDTIKAGEIIQVTGRNRVSLSTRTGFTDASGAEILWAGTVTEDVTLSGGGGTLLVAGAGIFETNGQYDTIASALTSGDVITILNAAASTVYQPNMFYHKQAFGLGSVPLPKLYATDTIMTTKDGIQIRVSKYSDGDANKNKIRFDLLPAYATFNPFFGGQGFGVA